MAEEHASDPSQAHLPLEERVFEVGGMKEKIGRVPWWLWVIWATVFLVAIMNWMPWPGTAFPKPEKPAAQASEAAAGEIADGAVEGAAETEAEDE